MKMMMLDGKRWLLLFAMFSIACWVGLQTAHAVPAAAVVETVPVDPNNPSTTPHSAYAQCVGGTPSTIPNYTTTPPSCASGTLTEVTIPLGAVVILPNATDSYTADWNFGDGSTDTTFAVSTSVNGSTVVVPNGSTITNYNVGTTHVYPATAAPGKTWTAVLTITDTSTAPPTQSTGNYYVVQDQDNLTARVNVGIDLALWLSHNAMWRGTWTAYNGSTVNYGGWDDYYTQSASATEPCVNGNICEAIGGIDANYIQAFEVNGHLENGPASDPYTEDVARAIPRMLEFLVPTAVTSKSVAYNPAVEDERCSDGTDPFANTPAKCSTGTLIQYTPGATSCPSGSCSFTFDINSNGQMLGEGFDYQSTPTSTTFEVLQDGQPMYETGMLMDALVASGNPAGIAKLGIGPMGALPGVFGQTYQNIVTDMTDFVLYCQVSSAYDNAEAEGEDFGGGWQYYCAPANNTGGYPANGEYDDNSVSQWDAIGLIAAERGFGVPIPAITTDTNQVWVTWSQETNISEGTFAPLADSSSLVGAFGYDEYSYEPWGPFAVTPSGMVQMSLDGVGRTTAASSDQRWNEAETFEHDNFCYEETHNSPPEYETYYYDPLYYTYGMFSFSKSMLLHNPNGPGGAIQPIVNVMDEPAGTNPFDWYGAQSPKYGGTAACDGFAQTLLDRQNTTGQLGSANENSSQDQFNDAWALIIWKQTVFVTCISTAAGAGTANSGLNPARIDISWPAQPNATSYSVYESSTNGGPYTSLVGTTATQALSDTSGLSNGGTYYFVVQPNNAAGAICQSNQVTVTVPTGRTR